MFMLTLHSFYKACVVEPGYIDETNIDLYVTQIYLLDTKIYMNMIIVCTFLQSVELVR